MTTGRIVYNDTILDLTYGVQEYRVIHTQERKQVRAASGVFEQTNLYGITELQVRILLDDSLRRKFQHFWWTWMREGGQFAFALDKNKMANTTLAAAVNAGHTSLTIPNLVTNGDMELDSDWSDVGTPTTNERSNEQANGGTYSRKFLGSAAADGIASATFSIVAGETYSASLHDYPVSAATTIRHAVLEGSGAGGGTAYIKNHTGLTSDAWNAISFEFVPSITGGLSRFRAQTTATHPTATIYTDDVVIRPKLTAGDELLLIADGDNEREPIAVSSVSGLTVNTSTLLSDFASGDVVRHADYWPALVSLDDRFEPQHLGADLFTVDLRWLEALS